jgi:guanylate kinase
MREDLGYSVSATTRPQRPKEQEGIDYHFLSPNEFQTRIDGGDFLEWASYGGFLYGTLVSEIEEILEAGKHAVLDIEVIGARKARERLANVVSIFILPPSAEALRDRLSRRKTEGTEAVGVRLQHAIDEVGAAAEYDYTVVNDDLEQAVEEVNGIIEAECRRTTRLNRLVEASTRLRDALIAEAQSLQP